MGHTYVREVKQTVGMYIPVSTYTEAVMTPQLDPPCLERSMQFVSCDLPVRDLMWNLSPGISIQLLKQSMFLTHHYSNYPEHSQAFQSLFSPFNSAVVGPTTCVCSSL